jgi:hypothetical protein
MTENVLSTKHKASKSEVRRQNAEIRQLISSTPKSLPDAHGKYLSHFAPQAISSELHPVAIPAIRSVMERAVHIRGFANFCKHTSDVSALVKWALDNKKDLGWVALMSHKVIYEFSLTNKGARRENTSKERTNRLIKLATRINPGEGAPPPPEPIGHRKIQSPYTPNQDRAIIRVAKTQPTAIRQRQLCLIVGLARGAGVSIPEIRLMIGCDVTDRGGEGIDVLVGAVGHKRIIPVRRTYEELVRIGIKGIKPGELLLGRVVNRRNVTSDIISNSEGVGNAPHIDAARLRTTWIAELMLDPIPIAVILTAAGLKSARTLSDLIPYLQTQSTETLKRSLLQGALR